MGGSDGNYKNDVWKSSDNGKTWTQLLNAGWAARGESSSVVMPDGSIVMTGGRGESIPNDWKNDVWRFMPIGSSAQNPSHTYSTQGTYRVALQVSNTDGYNSTRKTGYIVVTGIADIGVFRPASGNWYLNYNKNGVVDKIFHFGTNSDMPVVGDWDGNGISDAGVFRPTNGNWYLDTSKTGVVTTTFHFGTTGDIPVVGDWDADGDSDVGVFRPSNGNWYLDTTKTGVVNQTFHFGTNGDNPIVGKWV
jgi:PKD repeat protein